MKRFLQSLPAPISHLRIIGDNALRVATQIFFCAWWAGYGLVGTCLAQSPAPEPVTLTGRVLDPQGAAVPGAAVRLLSCSAVRTLILVSLLIVHPGALLA